MKFHITEGLGKISIRLSEIGSYFYFKRPLTVVWHDCRGSVGKYLCLLPYDSDILGQIKRNIQEGLLDDYTNKDKELKELLNPLLLILSNGEYSLNYYSNQKGQIFQYTSSSDNYSTIHQSQWYVLFSEPQLLTAQESKIKEYEIFVFERKEKNQCVPDILEFTTTGFYDVPDISFIATQPKSEIDQNRVKYFEDLIRRGKRPFAIIFNCKFESYTDYSMQSDNYILDGHHKLLAYKNLGITPSIVEVTHYAKTREEIKFNIVELIDVLYPWQINHILENWSEKERYILEYLQNPESKLHKFIKNGHYEEFHKNGKIKHTAFYVNNKIEGEAYWWYDNGQLEKKEIYQKGVRMGECTEWYDSGRIRFIQRFDELGRHHGRLVSYYENGQIQRESFLKNGINKNGYSSFSWYESGTKEAELKYLNGQAIERKRYSRQGELTSFEEFDFEQRKLIHVI